MSDGMGREFMYLSSHATNRYFIPNWGIYIYFSLFLYLFTFLPFYKVPKVLQEDNCQNEEQEQVKSFPSEEVSEGEPCLYVLVQIVAIISYHGTTDDDA